jgi:hypothetical protein
MCKSELGEQHTKSPGELGGVNTPDGPSLKQADS